MRKNENQYNGWTNYETWSVSLWISNNQHDNEFWADAASRCLEDAGNDSDVQTLNLSVRQVARFRLANQLKDVTLNNSPLSEPSLYSDLLAASLREVNWEEVANSWLNEL